MEMLQAEDAQRGAAAVEAELGLSDDCLRLLLGRLRKLAAPATEPEPEPPQATGAEPRKCTVCGEQFSPGRSMQRFCGEKCRTRATARAQPQRLMVDAGQEPLTAAGNPVCGRHTTMPRYLWNIDADGWPLERIDTLSG